MSAGALTWTELAQLHFKSTVAEMNTLGPYNNCNGPVSRRKTKITPLLRMMGSDPAITQARSSTGNAANTSSSTTATTTTGSSSSSSSSNPFARPYSSEVTKDDVVAAIDITAPTINSKLCAKRNFYLLSNS